MRLTVNGEHRQTQATRVRALLDELDYSGTHLAIAVNHEVVPRARWADTALNDGDSVEILTPRQGG
jgi:sulfur carrier protein